MHSLKQKMQFFHSNGIHFFLQDGLKHENLSGKTECMRRGLLLQLQLLQQAYPTLQFTSVDGNYNTSNRVITYINNDNTTQNAVNSSRLSTSSGGSAHYSTGYSNGSSIGYSGDGVVPPQPMHQQPGIDENEEFYEEFDDNNEMPSIENSVNSSSTIETNTPTKNQLKYLDDSYSTEGDLIPFRMNIACCDHHGVLVKKSKSFLKNSRYLCVLANGMFYLYQRESDDRQRKVIDLLKYSARSVCSDDKKKREFAFELIAPAKKTHVFSCNTSRDREEWIQCINRSVPVNGQGILPPINRKPKVEPIEDQIEQDEFYEQLTTEDPDSPQLRMTQHSATENNNTGALGEYYEVPDDEPDGNNGRKPPQRPPLPEVLKQLKQQSRPLPVAPRMQASMTEEEPAIYWEIDDEDSFETFDNDESFSSSGDKRLHSRSLSQEIFDTINERVPICQNNKCETENEDVEETDFEYDVPAEINLVIRETELIGDDSSCDDNEYQVPANSAHSSIYQVPPSNPIPVTFSNFNCNEEVISNESTPLTQSNSKSSVKELIAKLNRSEEPIYRSSLRQKTLPKATDSSESDACSPPSDKKLSLLGTEIEKLKEELKMKFMATKQSNDSSSIGVHIAKFAYVAAKSGELSFSRGEPILITSAPEDSMWWAGQARNKEGLVHKGYLRKEIP